MSEIADDVRTIQARMAADSGRHTSLDDAMNQFGIDRAELEAENDSPRE